MSTVFSSTHVIELHLILRAEKDNEHKIENWEWRANVYLEGRKPNQCPPPPRDPKQDAIFHIGIVISRFDTGSLCNEDAILTSDFLL